MVSCILSQSIYGINLMIRLIEGMLLLAGFVKDFTILCRISQACEFLHKGDCDSLHNRL